MTAPITAFRRAAYRVTTPDGVSIAVQEWGNPDGYDVIFIHGFSMCHLCWSRQVASELARTCRIITYDLRGHGSSEKPLEPRFYRESSRWADELAAIIERASVGKPVLVAWSYGMRIVSDYLSHHGSRKLAGLNIVGSKTNSDPAFGMAAMAEYQNGMASPELETNIRSTVEFVKGCARNWDSDALERGIAMSMIAPQSVRAALLGRPLDADDQFRSIDIPVLFTHGQFDPIVNVAASRYGQSITPGSSLSVFENSGHSPFMEEADRFNGELADFVARCNR